MIVYEQKIGRVLMVGFKLFKEGHVKNIVINQQSAVFVGVCQR